MFVNNVRIKSKLLLWVAVSDNKSILLFKSAGRDLALFIVLILKYFEPLHTFVNVQPFHAYGNVYDKIDMSQ